MLVSEQGGLIELYEAWLTFISTAMVKLTRFDPFSDADTEQQLFDALPALTRQAAENGQTVAAVSNGDNTFEVSLSRDQLAESAQPIYRELVRLLHALRPAGSDVSIIMPESVAMLPGLREMLQQFVGCELVATPEGFARCGDIAARSAAARAGRVGETVAPIAAQGAAVARCDQSRVKCWAVPASARHQPRTCSSRAAPSRWEPAHSS